MATFVKDWGFTRALQRDIGKLLRGRFGGVGIIWVKYLKLWWGRIAVTFGLEKLDEKVEAGGLS